MRASTAPKEAWIAIAARRAARAARAALPASASSPTPKSDKDFRLWFASPRHAGGRHRPRPHGARPRRRRLRSSGRDRRPRRSTRRSTASAASPPRSRPIGLAACTVFEANPKIVAHLAETRAPAQQAGRDDQSPVPALLALQEPDHLPRHQPVVRAPGRARATRQRCASTRSTRSTAPSGSRPGAETASAA